MGVTIGQIVILILVLMSPILLCLAIIAACIIIDKWIDTIFYPFEILRDKIDNYRQRKDLESWWEENENSQEDDIV
jgi:hypothetical protein|nr:MAG TPA: Protein of unknown function (DUF4014) [Herelleviridae sp.]